MRKLIGTLVIIGAVYAGFFGIDKFGIKPFIKEWIDNGGLKETKENVVDLTSDLKSAAMEIESMNNRIKNTVNSFDDGDIHENVHEIEEEDGDIDDITETDSINNNGNRIINIYSDEDDALEVFDSEDIDTVKVVIEDLSNYDGENH